MIIMYIIPIILVLSSADVYLPEYREISKEEFILAWNSDTPICLVDGPWLLKTNKAFKTQIMTSDDISMDCHKAQNIDYLKLDHNARYQVDRL
jgi:hypothetical protein